MGTLRGVRKKTLPWVALLLLVPLAPFRAQGGKGVRLSGHFPAKDIARSSHVGRLDSAAKLKLMISLHPRDEAGQKEYARRVSDPADPLFRHFLTVAQYKARFAPTDADVKQVTDNLAAKGLTVTKVYGNNLGVDVEASSGVVEKAFQVEMHEYLSHDGRRVRAPSGDPMVDAEIAARIQGVHGLSGFLRARKNIRKPHGQPRTVGGFTPTEIQTAYGFSTSSTAGSGQTIALYELDGYTASDIDTYASTYSITLPTINNTLLDSATGAAGADADEVTLDIEMLLAVAPAATIDVMMAKNEEAGMLDILSTLSTDASVNEVSISWGIPEDDVVAYPTFYNTEETYFSEMATQGQSVFVATGDLGAYGDSSASSTLVVQDPSTQLYVTAVGGTTLTVNSGTFAYVSETSWNESSIGEGSGGGGTSQIWPLSSLATNWQSGFASAANFGSFTQRNVPDVSLNADPETGYLIYYDGTWQEYGGTSAAAPIWAAYIAQVNQARVALSEAQLGSLNATLYTIGQSSLYSGSFHDVNDGSTNMYFPAVTGYDLSTGLGSPVGASLQTVLVASSLPPLAPTGVATAGAGGSTVNLSWTASANAATYSVYRASSLGGIYSLLSSAIATTSYSDSTAGSTTYYYYVVAVNSAGSSGSSVIHSGGIALAAPSSVSSLTVQGAP